MSKTGKNKWRELVSNNFLGAATVESLDFKKTLLDEIHKIKQNTSLGITDQKNYLSFY